MNEAIQGLKHVYEKFCSYFSIMTNKTDSLMIKSYCKGVVYGEDYLDEDEMYDDTSNDSLLELENDIKKLKNELILKNEQIKSLISECKVKDIKVENSNRQVLYEQNRNTELNKEIKGLEKEIRRLLKIIDEKER